MGCKEDNIRELGQIKEGLYPWWTSAFILNEFRAFEVFGQKRRIIQFILTLVAVWEFSGRWAKVNTRRAVRKVSRNSIKNHGSLGTWWQQFRWKELAVFRVDRICSCIGYKKTGKQVARMSPGSPVFMKGKCHLL